MIAVNTNILVYAHRRDSEWHTPTASCLKDLAEGRALQRGLAALRLLPMVHDARIAALCLQHGVRELWTADRDFSRFREITVRNPLITA